MCLYFTENISFVDFPQTLSSSFIIVCWWRCQNNKVLYNIPFQSEAVSVEWNIQAANLFKCWFCFRCCKKWTVVDSDSDCSFSWSLTAVLATSPGEIQQDTDKSRKTSRLLTPAPPWSSWYTAPSSCSLSWPTRPDRWREGERTGRSTSQT